MQEEIKTLEESNGDESPKKDASSPSLFASYVKPEEPKDKEEEIIAPLPSSELVFEIMFLVDPKTKQSAEVYTKTEPLFALNGVVAISDAFGSSVLKETVLGRQVVERKCRKELAQTSFTVDCKQGILVKAIEPQDWMFQDEITTKQEFDKAVLEAFRIVQEQVTKELHEQAIHQAQVQAQLEEQTRLKIQNAGQGGGGVPLHNPVYNLQPGDEGYNPNNDPNRRGKAQPVNDQALEDL